MRKIPTADEISAMSSAQYKTYVDLLRRAARRQGLVLVKSRARDPKSLEYGGFMLADENNSTVTGAHPHAFSLGADDVDRYLQG